jgi:hypothetical protein
VVPLYQFAHLLGSGEKAVQLDDSLWLLSCPDIADRFPLVFSTDSNATFIAATWVEVSATNASVPRDAPLPQASSSSKYFRSSPSTANRRFQLPVLPSLDPPLHHPGVKSQRCAGAI